MATTDLSAAGRARRTAGAGLALCTLLLGLPLAALAQAPGEGELLERLRQLRGELAATPGAPGEADQQLLSPQEVEEALGQRLGVQVLGVEPVEASGPARYAVKVMNPPGDYNAAFLVTTLLVDAASGEILGEAELSSGLTRPARPAAEAESGLELRRRSHR